MIPTEPALRLTIFIGEDDKVGRRPAYEAIVTIGSKEGLAHAPLAFINPGDVALVPEPAYPVYHIGAMFAGGDLRLRAQCVVARAYDHADPGECRIELLPRGKMPVQRRQCRNAPARLRYQPVVLVIENLAEDDRHLGHCHG